MNDKEVLKLALDALEHCKEVIIERGLGGNPEFAQKWGLTLPIERSEKAITAIKQALAAPTVQEPVAMGEMSEDPYADGWTDAMEAMKRTAPPAAQPAPGQWPTPEDQPVDNGPDYEDGPDEEGFSGPRPWNSFSQPAPVQQKPVAWVTVEDGKWISTRSADFRHITDGQYQLYVGPLAYEVPAAIKTLEALGYIYEEGEQWTAPPQNHV